MERALEIIHREIVADVEKRIRDLEARRVQIAGKISASRARRALRLFLPQNLGAV